METSDYSEDRYIDPDALDVEWLEQADLYGKYATLKAKAVRERDKAHERLKIVRSQLIKEIKADFPKMTEKLIEAEYRTRDEHMEAKADLIEAEYRVNVLDGAVFSMVQRKTALENLVVLAMGNYFATPTVPRDLSMEAQQKAASRKTKEMIKNRTTGPTKSRSRRRRE